MKRILTELMGWRFQSSLKIINDPAAWFWLAGAVRLNAINYLPLPACMAGGFDGLIAQTIQHGAGL
jgi:hypothetical protein